MQLDDTLAKQCPSPSEQFVKFDFNSIETIDSRCVFQSDVITSRILLVCMRMHSYLFSRLFALRLLSLSLMLMLSFSNHVDFLFTLVSLVLGVMLPFMPDVFVFVRPACGVLSTRDMVVFTLFPAVPAFPFPLMPLVLAFLRAGISWSSLRGIVYSCPTAGLTCSLRVNRFDPLVQTRA